MYINKHLNPIPIIKLTINGRHNYFKKHNSSASKPTEIIRKIFLMWHSLTLKVLCSKVIQISHQYIYKPILSQVCIYMHVCLYTYTYHLPKNEIKHLTSQGMLYTNIPSFFSNNVLQLCNISWLKNNSVHTIICNLHSNENRASDITVFFINEICRDVKGLTQYHLL